MLAFGPFFFTIAPSPRYISNALQITQQKQGETAKHPLYVMKTCDINKKLCKV
jgi:hypothetical protein